MLRVEFISDPVYLTSLRDRWERLSTGLKDHDAPFFQSFDWSVHVALTRLRYSGDRYRLLVATVWNRDNLAGIWPLSQQRRAGAWIVRSLDDPFGQFSGALFENREDIAPGIAAIVQALRERRLGDGVQVEGVIVGTPLHGALAQVGARCRYLNHAVSVDLRAYASIAEYRSTLNKKTLKNLRNLINRLRRSSVTQHVIAHQGEQLATMVKRTFDDRVDWLQTHARTSPAFRDTDFRPLIEGLVSSNVSLLGFSFEGDKDFLSAQWGFTYLGRYYSYLSAKNPKYDAFSPGRLHLGMVIDACKSRGINILELMAPASDYKLEWTNQVKQLDSFAMPFTLRGYVLLNLVTSKIGPAVRSASRLMPKALRKPLIRFCNRN